MSIHGLFKKINLVGNKAVNGLVGGIKSQISNGVNPSQNLMNLWLQIAEKTRIELIFLLILVVTGLLAFGLGRLSMILGSPHYPVQIELPRGVFSDISSSNQVLSISTSTQSTASSTSQLLETKMVVASSRGSKYHFPWCPGAKTISAKNKITFKSPELAQKAGYTLAANCK